MHGKLEIIRPTKAASMISGLLPIPCANGVNG